MDNLSFPYRGKRIVISEQHPNATVSVDGRIFSCHHHHEREGHGLPMWMSEEAMFASPDLTALARHFADYIYLLDDPHRVMVNERGDVVRPQAHPDDEHGPDHSHRKGR